MYSGWRPVYLIALSILLLSSYFFRHTETGLTKANYDRIKIGMSQDEVDDILGGIYGPMEGQGTCTTKAREMTTYDNGEIMLYDADVKWQDGNKSITIQF